MRVVSGIQPSGRLHLGNYFGAVRQFLRLQQGAVRPFYFIADLHALTTVHDGPLLRARTLGLALDLLALGLDPSRCTLFRQSDVPEVPSLAWVLASVTPMGLLMRAHAYKDKLARGLAPNAALFTYPVLMAADVLVLDADRVPVGQDQKQHLEMARDMAARVNQAYAAEPDRPLLKLPEAWILEAAALVPGTDGKKMSKSYGNTIDLFADDETVRRQIMQIKTDSTPVGAPKPAPAPLLTLLELLCDAAEAAEHHESWHRGGVGYATYKARLVERFFDVFGEARRRRVQLATRPDDVLAVLRAGAAHARPEAAAVLERVRRAVGLGEAG